MTIRNSSVVTILVRWFSSRWWAVFAAVLLAGAAAQTQHKTTSKAPAKTAAKSAPKSPPKAPTPMPGTLSGLVKAYREAPSAARRALIESWAANHPKDRPGAALALGVASYEQRDISRAVAELRRAQPALPQLADYIAYYVAAARVESKDFGGIVKELSATHNPQSPSPLSGKARLLEARALRDSAPAEAVRLLREHASELPQPDGDLLLGESQQAAGDLAGAAATFQRVYCQYVTGDTAMRAATALASLRIEMGAMYPALSGRDMLRHADRLMEVREVPLARTEYKGLAERLSASERDQALVRLGWTEYLSGRVPAAESYLRSMEVPTPEAEAERLYYVVECARRLDNDGDLKQAMKRLEEYFAKSPWRAKALLSAANHFLVNNRPEDYLPLYRALYEDFPADAAAGNSHWKVTFDAYLHRKSEAIELLKEQLVRYPRNSNAGAALYFLARSAEEQRDYTDALAYYQHLAKMFENYYYAMLARDRMRRPEVRGAGPSPETAQFLAAIGLPAAKPVPVEPTPQTASRIERSELLRAAGLSDLADAELRFGARTDGQAALLGMEAARAAVAPGVGLHVLKTMVPDHLGVPISAAPRQFWELLYPLPYRDELFASARAHDLDPYLVAGLIRQESEFSPGAVSPAKAYGLMQVLPVTGRQFARAAGIARFSTPLLLQPSANLKIGTLALRSMLDHSGGHIEQTLAAYNAGPNRMAEWVTWTTPREPAEFVESIPFTETRDYVQAVLRNADMYRRLYP